MLSIKPEPSSDAPPSPVHRRSERWFWPAVIAVLALGSVSAAWVSRVPPTGFTAAFSDPTGLDNMRPHPLGFAAMQDHSSQPNRVL